MCTYTDWASEMERMPYLTLWSMCACGCAGVHMRRGLCVGGWVGVRGGGGGAD